MDDDGGAKEKLEGWHKNKEMGLNIESKTLWNELILKSLEKLRL